ncbi:MAG: ABC transporter ATP-binding protein, partial [Flavobacteriales bacterium]
IQFGYHGDPVIRDVSFTVPVGKTVALVGPSGSGKTTLASLLVRYYDPQQGQVLLDGSDIRQITLASLRSQIGFVSQDAVLFNDSIRNNIALGQELIDEERLCAAAREANAEEFIVRMDAGYDYRIGDGGNKLSGGQRQRLAIARALYRNPPILILDEATSALDNESEKLVQDALFNLMENRTCLVIAHRLSTVQRADEILVLDKGSITERGKHSELMALKGLYYRLVQSQEL